MKSKKWLKPGEQTVITQKIREITNDFKGKRLEEVFHILDWIDDKVKLKQSEKKTLFRKRTSHEIIEDGFATGCTDLAVVFISLARASGIPTKYVEAVERIDFKKKGEKLKGSVKGHVFAKCFINKKWRIVDPAEGTVDTNSHRSHFRKNYIIVEEGVDAWDIGLKKLKTISKDLISKLKERGKLEP